MEEFSPGLGYNLYHMYNEWLPSSAPLSLLYISLLLTPDPPPFTQHHIIV